MKRDLIRFGLFLLVSPLSLSQPFGQLRPLELGERSQTASQGAPAVVRLEDLVRLALERSPELQAARHGVDVMQSRISPARTLPDPEVAFGQMNEGNIIPFTNLGNFDFSEIYLGFTQTFPFPGKLGLRGKVADMEAKVEMSRYRSATKSPVRSSSEEMRIPKSAR